VVRIDFEDCGSFRPGLADDLIGCSPFQGLQVLGEVVGGDEGQDMGLQAMQIVVVEDLDCGVLDGAVHSLGLSVGPRVIGLGQPVLDAVLHADSVEDVGSQEAARLSVDLAATTAIRQAEVGTAKTGVTGVGGSR
jgi:hypothetical protein